MHEMEKIPPNFQSMHYFLMQRCHEGKAEGMLKPNSTTSSKRSMGEDSSCGANFVENSSNPSKNVQRVVPFSQQRIENS